MSWFKKKDKNRSQREEDMDIGKPGTFKYAKNVGMKNPVEFYHTRIGYLKEKRKNKRNNQKSLLKSIKKFFNKKKEVFDDER